MRYVTSVERMGIADSCILGQTCHHQSIRQFQRIDRPVPIPDTNTPSDFMHDIDPGGHPSVLALHLNQNPIVQAGLTRVEPFQPVQRGQGGFGILKRQHLSNPHDF